MLEANGCAGSKDIRSHIGFLRTHAYNLLWYEHTNYIQYEILMEERILQKSVRRNSTNFTLRLESAEVIQYFFTSFNFKS